MPYSQYSHLDAEQIARLFIGCLEEYTRKNSIPLARISGFFEVKVTALIEYALWANKHRQFVANVLSSHASRKYGKSEQVFDPRIDDFIKFSEFILQGHAVISALDTIAIENLEETYFEKHAYVLSEVMAIDLPQFYFDALESELDDEPPLFIDSIESPRQQPNVVVEPNILITESHANNEDEEQVDELDHETATVIINNDLAETYLKRAEYTIELKEKLMSNVLALGQVHLLTFGMDEDRRKALFFNNVHLSNDISENKILVDRFITNYIQTCNTILGLRSQQSDHDEIKCQVIDQLIAMDVEPDPILEIELQHEVLVKDTTPINDQWAFSNADVDPDAVATVLSMLLLEKYNDRDDASEAYESILTDNVFSVIRLDSLARKQVNQRQILINGIHLTNNAQENARLVDAFMNKLAAVVNVHINGLPKVPNYEATENGVIDSLIKMIVEADDYLVALQSNSNNNNIVEDPLNCQHLLAQDSPLRSRRIDQALVLSEEEQLDFSLSN